MQKNVASCLIVVSGIVLLVGGGLNGTGRTQPKTRQVKEQDKPVRPLYQVVFLKPGETKDLYFATVGPRQIYTNGADGLATGDRTQYRIKPVTETGEDAAGLKGVTVAASYDRQIMDGFIQSHKTRCVLIQVSASKDAEEGSSLMQILAMGFGRQTNNEAIIKVVVNR